MKKSTRTVQEITTIAAMATILEAGKWALSAVPNVELVSLLLMLYTLYFGPKRTLITIYIFDAIESLIWGFGLWSVSYLFVWDILVLLTWALRSNKSQWPFVVLSAVFGLSFGALCSITTLVIGGPHAALSWWIAGIPYDVAHCIGNAAVASLLFTPLSKALQIIIKRFGFNK